MQDTQQISDGLRSLAISDTGFIFDPRTGHSYTVNHTGLVVLRSLKEGRTRAEIIARLTHGPANVGMIDDDLNQFVKMLAELGLPAAAHGESL